MISNEAPEYLREALEPVASKRHRAYAALGLGSMLREKSTPELLETTKPETALAVKPTLESVATSLPDPVPSRAAPVIHARSSITDLATLGWPELQAAVSQCQACEFAQHRRQTVFGSGNVLAKLAVITDPPGAQEDEDGQPLAGSAGKLFDAMLASLGLNRQEHIYLSGVLKCRPSPAREASSAEFAQCQPFLNRQLELLRPQGVLVTGRFAAKSVLRVESSLAALRGKVHHMMVAGIEIPIVVTFDPAYLLRNPGDKAKAWADLCLLHAEMKVFDALGSVGFERDQAAGAK